MPSSSHRIAEPQVLENALRWSDGRRIFVGESPIPGRLLFRMEAEPDAVDEAVLDLLDELERRMVAAVQARTQRAVIAVLS